MATPKRSDHQTAISISIEKELLKKIDERSTSLGLNRSLYLANLARQDIARGGRFTLHEADETSFLRATRGTPEDKAKLKFAEPDPVENAKVKSEMDKIHANAKNERQLAEENSISYGPKKKPGTDTEPKLPPLPEAPDEGPKDS